MEMIYVFLVVVQSVAISLGVGCSTVAIVNFFVAIADGTIDPNERKMMGVVYILLRVTMVLILLTSVFLLLIYTDMPTQGTGDTFTLSRFILIGALFGNAFLMTKRIMPSNFGPAIQAGSWYTLGIVTALVPLALTNYSLFEFAIGYLAALALAVSLVNGVMGYLKHKRSQ
jgi:hypothetical protein